MKHWLTIFGMFVTLGACTASHQTICDRAAVPYDVSDQEFALQWHIDNPRRLAANHSSQAIMRQRHYPSLPDTYAVNDTLYSSFDIAGYTVSSRAAGPVYVLDHNTSEWSVIWIEIEKPSTKTVESLDDDWVRINLDGRPYAVLYHLSTHTYEVVPTTDAQAAQ